MNVLDDLILAGRLPTDDGWTFTLASRPGDLIQRAEHLFGPRDMRYTPLGVEFSGDGPQTWYPGNCRHVLIQLSPTCATDRVRAYYQLAHETIHLLSPTGVPRSGNVLEEGLATVFSYRYIRELFNEDWSSSGDARYDMAAVAVERLLTIDPSAIARLRVYRPVISAIDSELILAHVPGVGQELADHLGSRFPY